MSTTDITLVTGHRSGSRRAAAAEIAHTHGKICVPVPRTAATEPWAQHAAAGGEGIIAELSHDAAVESTIAGLADDPHSALTEVICVVEATTFIEDILDDEYFTVESTSPALYVARALRLVQHIEHASALLVTEWTGLATRDLSILLAVLSHLAPAARIRLSGSAPDAPPTTWSESAHQPGWVHMLNAEHRPHMTDLRVRAFRYEQIRPFHPGRLSELLQTRFGDGEFGAVIRSAGFCRLATRPGIVGGWEHVGQMISLAPLARDSSPGCDPLSVGQEIAFIGIDLDIPSLRRAFDAATLTDDELIAGPEAWARFDDPFPEWATSDEER